MPLTSSSASFSYQRFPHYDFCRLYRLLVYTVQYIPYVGNMFVYIYISESRLTILRPLRAIFSLTAFFPLYIQCIRKDTTTKVYELAFARRCRPDIFGSGKKAGQNTLEAAFGPARHTHTHREREIMNLSIARIHSILFFDIVEQRRKWDEDKKKENEKEISISYRIAP